MSKMDRWLARAESKASTPPGEASSKTPAAEQAPRKLDRWLSRAEKNSPPPDDGISAVLGDSASLGGLSACCHLIKLLEAHELVKVKDVLVASMRERGLDGELVEAPKLAAPEIPADASAATRKLGEVMTHLAELANEAGRRELAAAKAIKTEEEEAKALQRQEDERKERSLVANGLAGSAAMGGGGGGDQGGGKLGRWLKRAEQKAAEPKSPEPEGKLGRWLARAERKSDDKAPEAEVDESSSDPLDVALRCCARVRRCWQTSDKAGGGAVFLKEKAKLAADKRALENLMQMVYAVRNTPEQVEGALTPPGGTAPSSFGMPHAVQAGRPPLPPGALNGGVSMGGMTNGPPGGGPPGHSGGAAIGAQPVVARGGTDMSAAREERVKQNDPDELLKQFLADRKKERAQEQANMVEDKKNPKKVEGKGWRAGSPMSSAAKPKEAVRISLTRPPPPPQFQAQVVMLGPPPEGVQQGNSREDVMSKEGGNGFFFYPPGHPNHVASVAQAEGQLRSGVHPQERIAPHWSQASFKAAGMPEVICESRHATFGPLSEVEARLVRCQPPEANAPIKNVDQVKGNIVYIKRGGCSFTKKARMAQEAGAIAVVVANTDRETFGMSYTDDGQPFENISIPCVMISSDVCEKLESCRSSPKDGRAPWTCKLTPLHRGDPLTKMHEEMSKMSANLPPGAALAVQIPEEIRQTSAAPAKKPGVLKRLKSMLP